MNPHKKERQHAIATFERIAADKKPYVINILRRKIRVLPDVFSPKYFSDVKWFAKEIPKVVGKRSFLEIGTGTGIVSLFVALHGATKIITTDINPAAVKNAQGTFRLHRLRIPVRLGDVFRPVRPNEQFDVIFWNHPFHFAEERPKTMLERGGYDYQYRSLRAFFAGAKNHLTPGGEVLLGTSKNARLDLIRKFAREYGYLFRLIKKQEIPSEHRKGVTIDVRIHSFRVQK